jgi:hypothetical protein
LLFWLQLISSRPLSQRTSPVRRVTLLLGTVLALLLEWFSNEESAELAAGLDRLLTGRSHGWPSRPVIR